MTLFTDPVLLSQLQNESSTSSLVNWLNVPPSYTTFRVNKLKPGFSLDQIKRTLEEQNTMLQHSQLPECSLIRDDCILVWSWHKDVKLPHADSDIIVDAACGSAVLRGANVYAPGVVGMSPDIRLRQMVNIYADVEGTCRRGLKVPFEDKKRFVGFGQVKMLRSQLFIPESLPSGIAVEVILPASRLPVINESIAEPGQLLLQNLPSIVCGWVMNPKAGERILDMCAAPGNKTTHLAELSNNEAHITALDKTQSKVAKLKENCHIHSATCVQSYVQDATKCISEDSISVENGPPFSESSFDKILLDAPCSALGQRPQICNKMTAKMLQSYKFLQRRLFHTATRLLRPGGTLVYSTCTITRDENEGLVAWALEKFPSLRLVAAEPLLGGPGWAGCGLDDQQRLLVQRFGPEDDPLRKVDDIYRDTVGFFIAKFIKE